MVTATEAQIKFQRAWITELGHEHERITWRYKVNLGKPMIEISSSRREWGTWDANTRVIRISSAVILEHSWDVTINIFKHEMAHQIVTDVFRSSDAHGLLFEEACNMIGVPQAFRGARGDMPRTLDDFSEEELDLQNMKMLDKVRKLLSLAQSGNENEAFLAMQKANELIEKYNIDRIEQNKASRFVYLIIEHKKKRIENYQRQICLILQDHFFVNVVYSHLFEPTDGQTYRTIELLGTVENVRIAEYVYHFLMNQMDLLWKAHSKTRSGRGIGNKRSYRLGVLRGFHDKLNQQARARSHGVVTVGSEHTTMSALVCAEDKGLNTFMEMRFPRLWSFRPQGPNIDPSSFQAGLKDGKRLNIHRGIERKDGYQGRLLPSGSGSHAFESMS